MAMLLTPPFSQHSMNSLPTKPLPRKLPNMPATRFLDYCASNPDGSIRYHASGMVLKLHSNSSYLNAIRGCSQQGGHFYLGNKTDPDILNGTILNLTAIMKMVLSSTAEAEFGALFHNTKEATPLCTTLKELGHPQPPTLTLVDNSTAVGLANDTVTQMLVLHHQHAFLVGM